MHADPLPRKPLMSGFPPDDPGLVTLTNWQDPPFNRWAFQHLREVIPSHRITADPATRRELVEPPPGRLAALRQRVSAAIVHRLDGSGAGLDEILADTYTDAFVLLHHGEIVLERYHSPMTPQTPHLVMSVTKSIVGCVAGILVHAGRLDPRAPVGHYVPEVAHSGYGNASVRDLLDMRTGVDFSEAYTDPDAGVRVMERSMGWRPREDGDPLGMCAYLADLGAPDPHGGPFVYRSADTDMLGWVCERVAGRRMADLVTDLLWKPLGAEFDAEITCDGLGTAVHDGGLSATARDLARFGLLLADRGSVAGLHVVPRAWFDDAWHPGRDVVEAFAASDNAEVLPGGWYRNQFWFVPSRNGVVQLCLGIHGQMVYVDPGSHTVAVKLSSWPDAQDVHFLVDTIRAFGAVGAALHA